MLEYDSTDEAIKYVEQEFGHQYDDCGGDEKPFESATQIEWEVVVTGVDKLTEKI